MRQLPLFIFSNETPVLYHVLPEKRTDRLGGAMMASSHVYDMTGAGAPPPAVISAKRAGQDGVQREGMVELALDPSELDMDSDAMAVRYEQQMRENQSQLQKEDLSDMLAEHVAKQKVGYMLAWLRVPNGTNVFLKKYAFCKWNANLYFGKRWNIKIFTWR